MLLLVLLTACDEAPAGCQPDNPVEGELSAAINGEDWTGEGLGWLWAGSGLQLTSSSSTDWRVTVVAYSDADGQDLTDALATLPVTVPLDDETGWAILYQGDSSSRSLSGELVITAYSDGGVVEGCLEVFTESAELTGGTFSASAL